MRRLVPLALLLALVGLIALRSWTSDNLVPFRGQIQDVITLALSLLIESLPFIVLGIGLSIVVQVFVPPSWLESWLPKNPFARRAIVSPNGQFLLVEFNPEGSSLGYQGLTAEQITQGTVVRVLDLQDNTVVGEFPGYGFVW